MNDNDTQLPQPVADQVAALADAVPDDEAVGLMLQCVQFVQQAQFALAAMGYQRAAEAFDQRAGDPAAAVLAACCRASADAAKGTEFSRNGDRAKAIDHLSAAARVFKRQVLPSIGTMPDEEARRAVRAGVVLNLCGVQTSLSLAEMMADVANGNFSNALRTSGRIFRGFAEARDEIAGAELPAEVMTQSHEVIGAIETGIRGLEAYARAEQAAEDHRWADAAAAYDDATEFLRDASAACTAAPTLEMQAPMFRLLVETLVQPARRRSDHLQDVLADLDQFKQEMIALARAVGETKINVNAHQEVAQTVMASIEVKTTIINEFEDRTRTALQDLRAAIANAPIDAAQRKAVLAALDDVAKTAPHDEGFFAQFKQFCASSAGIVENIAKVAGPVATAWNVFAPFFGMPVLPIPAK